MAILWRRAAASFLCAVCGAATGWAALSATSNGSNFPPALRHIVSPTIEPASATAEASPAVVIHLSLPDESLPPQEDLFPGLAPVAASPAPAAVIRLRAPDNSLPQEEDLIPPPAPRRDAATYTVVAGDTLWVIATAAGVRVDALAAANDLSRTTVLSVGRVLIIPEAGRPASPPPGGVRPAAAPRPRAARVLSPAPAPVAQEQGTAAPLAMLWPSRGIVTSRFGWRVHPIFGLREFHTGMDIATRYGSPVVAAQAGVVTFVGWKTGYGRIILVKHDGGFETAYSHLSAAMVDLGDYVAQGQVIGRIGNSGWSTGPHLFFEVRRNGVPVDPARYLN